MEIICAAEKGLKIHMAAEVDDLALLLLSLYNQCRFFLQRSPFLKLFENSRGINRGIQSPMAEPTHGGTSHGTGSPAASPYLVVIKFYEPDSSVAVHFIFPSSSMAIMWLSCILWTISCPRPAV